MGHRVLVTGGAGFIGSSISLAVAARHPDWEVIACDNLFRRGSELNLPRLKGGGVQFHHADVRHPEDLARAGRIDALVECSAEPSVLGGGDVIVPVNLLGAYHCFEYAAHHRAQVIFLSTSRVYPVARLESLAYEETPTRFQWTSEQSVAGAGAEGIGEHFPLDGARTLYGASKLAAEVLLAEYAVAWTVDRCGVIAGPWQMGKVDQGVFTHWMLSFVMERPLQYIGYGGAGKQVRDLLHVEDLVDLIDRQLCDPDGWAGQVLNVGGGPSISLSLLETTELCRAISGHDVAIGGVTGNRPGDVRIYVSDCRALFERTEWRPRRGAEEVMRDIHDWAVEHEDELRSGLK